MKENKMNKNDVIFNPKDFHQKALDAIYQDVAHISALLDDAVNVKYINSKTALINECRKYEQFILGSLKQLQLAAQHMVAHPKASEAQVCSILKEVGLQDMDDPSYGNEYLIEGDKACDIFEQAGGKNKEKQIITAISKNSDEKTIKKNKKNQHLSKKSK